MVQNDVITKEKLLNTIGSFSWFWGQTFFIETKLGNFIWKDPGYNGDNTITLFAGTYEDCRKSEKVAYARDKGFHTIKDFCGEEFTLILP